jgi:hypothetical protein
VGKLIGLGLPATWTVSSGGFAAVVAAAPRLFFAARFLNNAHAVRVGTRLEFGPESPDHLEGQEVGAGRRRCLHQEVGAVAGREAEAVHTLRQERLAAEVLGRELHTVLRDLFEDRRGGVLESDLQSESNKRLTSTEQQRDSRVYVVSHPPARPSV